MRARGTWREALVALVFAAFALLTSTAAAEGRVPFLVKRLMYPPAPGQADDFRVRTSAALALGATHDDAAVAPLCAALSDPSEVVRHAAAVGLRRLARPSSVECLSARASSEPIESVKTEIQRAIGAVEAAGAAPAPPDSSSHAAGDAKYYVALSHVANHSSRASSEVEQIVRGAIASQLERAGKYRIAPAEETMDAARSRLKKGQLKGYFLATSVEKFDYSSDGLRVRVKIAVFSYPGKDLRGEVPTSGTLPGARPGDKSAEDELLSTLAGHAAELFAQNFQ
jgi:hypothetical protein